MNMITVKEALANILDLAGPLPAKEVPLAKADGRFLAAELHARRSQPGGDMAAMDGYAFRHKDITDTDTAWPLAGRTEAGEAPGKPLPRGYLRRIFTGAVLPLGADTVIMQENTEEAADDVRILNLPGAGRNVRKAGFDFAEGDILMRAGERLTPRALALAAAAGYGALSVGARPAVHLISTGNELVPPGTLPAAHQQVSSNGVMLSALLARAGADVTDHGILPDDRSAIQKAIEDAAQEADVLVTMGGASVGEADYVQDALADAGFDLHFWKIAMKPGKPVLFGALDGRPVLGLPGNPVSAFVTAYLFALPLVEALQGARRPGPRPVTALAGADLPENGSREAFIRARLEHDKKGRLIAAPLTVQDSGAMAALHEADALLHRKADAAPAPAGTPVQAYALEAYL